MLRSPCLPSRRIQLNTDAAGSAPPDAFGPFRVLHQIGAGALGPVFRAYHPEQDRLVAVKMFRLDLPPERVHQLVADLERLIASDLSHPGIAAPLATGIADVWAYLAQDFVAADSLDIVVRDTGPAAPGDVVRFATQLAGALDLAASMNIIHGALHPRDLLMSADDARITGLGVTRALERAGATVPIRRPYTAPERAAGEAWDRRADVFSLAALSFELLSGRRISGPGEPPGEFWSRQSAAVRDGLRRTFARALEEDPSDRFATAGEFSAALQEAFEPPAKSTARGSASRRPHAPAIAAVPIVPVIEDEPESVPAFAPLPADKLPLLTDDMLAQPEEPPPFSAVPAEDLGPPPIADALESLADHRLVREESPLPIELPGVERDLPWSADSFREERFGDDRFRDTREDRQETAEREGHHVGAGAAAAVATRFGDADSSTGMDAESSSSLAPIPEPPSAGVWPLILALVVGIALGFGSAMLLLGRDRASSAQTAAVVPQAQPAPVVVDEPPIREITERTPATPARPATAATATPAPPRPATAARAPAVRAPVVRAPATKPPVARAPAAKPPTARPPTARPATTTPRPVARGATAPAAAAASVKSGPGSLLVESRPTGASVFVDGKLLGRTPLTTEAVTAGEHAIHLEMAGYQRWASSVRITLGERSRIAASLEK